MLLVAKKKTLDELLAKKDFTGAAVAQAKILKLGAQHLQRLFALVAWTKPAKNSFEEQVRSKLSARKQMMIELASKRDFEGAAAAHKDMQEMEVLAEVLRAKHTMVDKLAAEGNFTGVTALLEEIKVMKHKTKEELKAKVKEQTKKQIEEQATAEAVAQEMKTLADQLAAKKKTMDELAMQKDFNGAEALQREVMELEKRLSALGRAQRGARSGTALETSSTVTQVPAQSPRKRGGKKAAGRKGGGSIGGLHRLRLPFTSCVFSKE